jgi:hypothetical protein
MAELRHPNKEIQKAIEYAIERGWRLEKASGHAWGRLYCPAGERGGCILSVNGTPRNPHAIARLIKARVNKCPH